MPHEGFSHKCNGFNEPRHISSSLVEIFYFLEVDCYKGNCKHVNFLLLIFDKALWGKMCREELIDIARNVLSVLVYQWICM